MKILLFGKNGQVGWELQRSLAPLGELVALDIDSREMCGDYADPEAVARTVRAVAPDFIVNAAAYTAVDQAENQPELARAVNALAPAVLASEARSSGAWLVHYSTDYVFDGSGDRPWMETDAAAPLNVYGTTKLEGERLIGQSGCRHLIFRSSWVYGSRGDNFARTMLKLAQERDSLNVVNDQVGAPTGADLLADVTAHAIRAACGNAGVSGLYHVAAGGAVSWYGYARFVLELAQREGVKLNVAPEDVRPVSSGAFPTTARRPHNSRLNTEKFKKAFGLHLPDWQAGVVRMLEEILDGKP